MPERIFVQGGVLSRTSLNVFTQGITNAEGARMRFGCVLIASLLVFGGCKKAEPPKPDLLMTATIKDIMDSMVDPSGDFMFESVAQIADENGITEKAPKT